MRAGPIQAQNIDLVAAILTASRKTFFPRPAEAMMREFYETRDQLHEEEVRRQAGAGA
jgi:hypothetical protein